jgi:hypothetical protein
MVTRQPEDPRPQVNIGSIEKLGWSTRKKIVDEQPVVVTKFSFEGEPTADQLRTLHALLKDGGALTVTITSPQLVMDLQVKEAEKRAREIESGTEETTQK